MGTQVGELGQQSFGLAQCLRHGTSRTRHGAPTSTPPQNHGGGARQKP